MKLATTEIFKHLKPNDAIELNNEQTKELQKVILSIADDVVEICEENNINYHLTGGTCLGAIRHKGFIPWDDDIDIDVARRDYNKLVEKIKEKYSNKYYIHNPQNKEGYSIPHTQVRLKNTIVRGINDDKSEQCGAYIDIAIMENTYNNKILRKIHGTISMILGFVVSCRKFAKESQFLLDLAKNNEEATKVFKTKIRLGKFFSFFTLRRWTIIYNSWNKICKKNNSEYVVVPTGRKHFFGEIYKREDFFETTTAEFEKRNWKIPKNYDKYLKYMYGDYMKLPKEEDREKHILKEFKLN